MHFQGKERQLHYRWFEGEAITGGKGRRPPFITMEGGDHTGLDWLGSGSHGKSAKEEVRHYSGAVAPLQGALERREQYVWLD